MSLRQIGKRTGQSRTKVLTELRKAGVVIRDFSRGSKQKHDPTQVMKSGTTPFGFTYLEGKLVMEPSEYRIVLEMNRHWQSGQSLRAIARILNDRGVATRFGKKWNHEVIKHIIERFEQQQVRATTEILNTTNVCPKKGHYRLKHWTMETVHALLPLKIFVAFD